MKSRGKIATDRVKNIKKLIIIVGFLLEKNGENMIGKKLHDSEKNLIKHYYISNFHRGAEWILGENALLGNRKKYEIHDTCI